MAVIMKDPVHKKQEPQVCTRCASHLAQPQDWLRMDDSTWQVTVRCPECYVRYDVTLDQDQVNRLSYALEGGFQQLLEEVDRLDHEAFEEDCRALIHALRSDSIYPMDF